MPRQTPVQIRRPSTVAPPTRWVCTDEPLTCVRCNTTWPGGDPALRIRCRGCGARPGSPCCRPGGGNERVCFQRDGDAVRSGVLTRCDGLTWDGRHVKPLALALSPMPHARRVITGAPPSMGLL